jgi:hypothetical protein
MYNSLVSSNDPMMASNECFELEDTEGPETVDAAQAGTSVASSNLIMCSEAVKSGIINAANGAFDLNNWLAGGGVNADTPANGNTNNVVVTGADIPGAVVDGGVGTRGYLTAASLEDINLTVVFDQSDVMAPGQLFDVAALGSIFETPAYLGGANAGDDWLAGWTVGLSDPLVP